MTDLEGNPFEYPYFIHDSYDSSDAVNMFDWEKATNAKDYPVQTRQRTIRRDLLNCVGPPMHLHWVQGKK